MAVGKREPQSAVLVPLEVLDGAIEQVQCTAGSVGFAWFRVPDPFGLPVEVPKLACDVDGYILIKSKADAEKLTSIWVSSRPFKKFKSRSLLSPYIVGTKAVWFVPGITAGGAVGCP